MQTYTLDEIDALRKIVSDRVWQQYLPGPDEAVHIDEREVAEQIERELRTAMIAGVKP